MIESTHELLKLRHDCCVCVNRNHSNLVSCLCVPPDWSTLGVGGSLLHRDQSSAGRKLGDGGGH